MAACGITSETTPQMRETEFYTSHEALLLPYEQALTRVRQPDRATGTTARRICCGSATARASSTARMSSSCAASTIRIGLKCGPTHGRRRAAAADRHAEPAERPGPPDPDRPHGRTTRSEAKLPPLIRAVKREGAKVVWSCDPMHGNTDQVVERLQDAAVRPHPGRGARASSPSIAPRAPMPAACISR